MTKRVSINKLMALGGMSSLLLVFQLIPAVANSLLFSRVIAGPLISIIYTSFTILNLYIFNFFGSASIMFTLYGILALPFNLLGFPGFFIKIFVALGMGVIADLIFLLFRNKKISLFVIGGPQQYYLLLVMVFLAQAFDIPGFQGQREFIFSPIVIFGILLFGTFGGFLGYLIYQKVNKSQVIKRIQR